MTVCVLGLCDCYTRVRMTARIPGLLHASWLSGVINSYLALDSQCRHQIITSSVWFENEVECTAFVVSKDQN
jgi:hypothetical protein